jgi:carboxymethylenebutenolidase
MSCWCPRAGCEIRSFVISPVGEGGARPGVLLYTDIFELTESTLRTAQRLASAGFVVCVPEVYPRGALAGVALEFDDAGKQAGQVAAARTTVEQFGADRAAVLDFLDQRAEVDELFAVDSALVAT